jgi:Fibronectin type III domain
VSVNATLGGTTATVSFGAPAFTGGSPVTSYRLTASSGPIVMNDVTSPVNVPSLAAGTGYNFSITATTSAGTGEAGLSNTVHTLPGTPTAVTAVPDDGRAIVSFSATPGNDPVTYTVTASSGQSATGASSPITVYGLPNDAPVTFRVKATTVAGDGPTSDASDPVTPVEGGREHPTPPAPSPRTVTPDPPASSPRPPVPPH